MDHQVTLSSYCRPLVKSSLFQLVGVVAWKDLRILSKDRGALIILFLLPLLIGVIYGIRP